MTHNCIFIGAVYFYHKLTTGIWSRYGKLSPMDAANSRFGSSVVLNDMSAMIGAPSNITGNYL